MSLCHPCMVNFPFIPMQNPSTPPHVTRTHLHVPDVHPTLLIDVGLQDKDDLMRLLKRYRLRQKINVADVSDAYAPWVEFGEGPAANPWPQDPRLRALGLRAVLPRGEAPPGALDGASASDAAAIAYRLWRLRQGVAEGSDEIPAGEAIALEYNIDGLNGISFSKGCYVGQELMARTHFKGVVRKRLMPFSTQGGLLAGAGAAAGDGAAAGVVHAGDDVYAEASSGGGTSLGKVRASEKDCGVALLRLAKALPAIEAGRQLHVRAGSEEGGVAEIRAWRPGWWPEEWGREA